MRLLVVSLGVATAGCHLSDGPAGDCSADGAATVRIGTGDASFVTLADGDPLPFVHGPQGGYHVFVSLRATGLVPGTGRLDDPDDPLLTIGLEADSAQLSSFDARHRALAAVGDDLELIGQLVVLDHPSPAELDARPATLAVDLEDRCGQTASDEVDVVLRLEVPR